jgi:hypothetical protein
LFFFLKLITKTKQKLTKSKDIIDLLNKGIKVKFVLNGEIADASFVSREDREVAVNCEFSTKYDSKQQNLIVYPHLGDHCVKKLGNYYDFYTREGLVCLFHGGDHTIYLKDDMKKLMDRLGMIKLQRSLFYHITC